MSNATVAKQTTADDKTVAKVRRKLEATSEIPRLEKTTGRDGRSRPATTSRAPSQKAGGRNDVGRGLAVSPNPAAVWQGAAYWPPTRGGAPAALPPNAKPALRFC